MSKIEDFLSDLKAASQDRFETIDAIRALFRQADPQLCETVKYGGLVFLKNDELLGGIFPYQHHISVEFSNGVDFSDPANVLQGNGKRRRHIKIETQADISANDVAAYIRQAVKQ